METFRSIPAPAQQLFLDAFSATCEQAIVQGIKARAGPNVDPGALSIAPPAVTRHPLYCAWAAQSKSKFAGTLFPELGALLQLEAFLKRSWGKTKPLQQCLTEATTLRKQVEESQHSQHFASTDSTVKKASAVLRTAQRPLNGMAEVAVKDLSLFSTMTNQYLKGKIATRPVGLVGVQIIVTDSTGDHVEVGVYNTVEGGDLASADIALPVGAEIVILEPFLKIFRTGSVGIRVDSPSDVIINPTSLDETEAAFAAALRKASQLDLSLQDLVKAGTSSETFKLMHQQQIRLLHTSSAVQKRLATVLSNAAQCLLKLGKPGHALLHSSGSLFVEPDGEKNSKAILRQDAALKQLREASGQVLVSLPWDGLSLYADQFAAFGDKKTTLEEAHAEGNAFFKAGDHLKALWCYRRGLHCGTFRESMPGFLARMVVSTYKLGFLAQCTTAYCAFRCFLNNEFAPEHNVPHIFGSLAFNSLNETETAQKIARNLKNQGLDTFLRLFEGKIEGKPFSVDPRGALRYNEATMSMVFRAEHCFGGIINANGTFPQWVHPGLALQTGQKKGRGVFVSNGSIAAGDVLLVDTPLVWKVADAEKEGRFVLATSTKEAKHSDLSLLRGEAFLMYSNAHDVYTNRMLGLLHDGEDERGFRKQTAASLGELRNVVEECGNRLLAPFPQGVREEMTQKRLTAVLRLNGLGGGEVVGGRKTLGLYPILSMCNHDLNYNATATPLQFANDDQRDPAMLLLACRDITAGEEVTICYSTDPVLLKEKWGIE